MIMEPAEPEQMTYILDGAEISGLLTKNRSKTIIYSASKRLTYFGWMDGMLGSGWMLLGMGVDVGYRGVLEWLLGTVVSGRSIGWVLVGEH